MENSNRIFHPVNIIDLTNKSRRSINISVPKFDEKQVVEEVYAGPSPADIRAEIGQLREEWQKQKAEEQRELTSQLEAQRREWDEERERLRAESEDLSQQLIADAQQQAKGLVERAELQAKELIENSKIKAQMIEEQGRETGHKEGVKEGYEEGFAEVRRLSRQLHYMISGVLQRREEIIGSLESDLIDLTLLIARKVVKVLSENQKDIVIYNTLEALKKLRGRGSVTLRVNPEDMDVSQNNKENFIREIERLEELYLVEDHIVERGGCIVESDFGEIDAQISSQLREVENQILPIRPVRRRSPRRLSDDIVRKDEAELKNLMQSLDSEQANPAASAAQ